jgi:hypothetical protein
LKGSILVWFLFLFISNMGSNSNSSFGLNYLKPCLLFLFLLVSKYIILIKKIPKPIQTSLLQNLSLHKISTKDHNFDCHCHVVSMYKVSKIVSTTLNGLLPPLQISILPYCKSTQINFISNPKYLILNTQKNLVLALEKPLF